MAAFSRYVGIDYSGAETPEASLKGLRVHCVVGESAAALREASAATPGWPTFLEPL